jgi:hypothetical protein
MPMPKSHKPDPYNGFKDDVERRRALNMRVICMAVVGVAFALSNLPLPYKEALLWLKTFFL